jgi:hypothetical protein
LVPPAGAGDRRIAHEALQRLRKRAVSLCRGPFDWTEWQAYRDEGRR